MVLGLFEFYVLAKHRNSNPTPAPGFSGAARSRDLLFLNDPSNILLIQFVIIVLTVGRLVAATLRGAPFDKMIASAGATVLGVLYIALLGSHLVSIRWV